MNKKGGRESYFRWNCFIAYIVVASLISCGLVSLKMKGETKGSAPPPTRQYKVAREKRQGGDFDISRDGSVWAERDGFIVSQGTKPASDSPSREPEASETKGTPRTKIDREKHSDRSSWRTRRPETTQPETTEPESTEPETTQPETTQPEGTEPDGTENSQ